MTENRLIKKLALPAVGCLITAVAIINYWPVLNNTLIADDWAFVYTFHNSPFYEVSKLFTTQAPLFVRPMTMFVFWIHSNLFGFNPWPSHLINVFLHAGSAFLIFLFMWRMGAQKTTALIATFLFVLTPVAPETVTWSSGRGDVLSLFFILMAMVFYGTFLTKRKQSAFVGAMIASAAALLSKESAYLLLILLPAMEFIYGNKFSQKDIREDRSTVGKAQIIKKFIEKLWTLFSDRGFLFRQAVLLSLAFGNVVLHYAVLGRMGGYGDVPLARIPRLGSIRATLRTMLSPLNEAEFSLGIIHSLRNYTIFLCLAGIALVLFRWRKTAIESRKLFMMMMVFFTASVLVVNVPLLSNGIYQNLKESRLLYAPTLGFIALTVIMLLEFIWQKRFWKIAAVSLVVLLLPIYTVGLYFNNVPWQRAASINASIAQQTLQLVPNPPPGARLTFTHLLFYKDSYIVGYGFEESIYAAYGRDDIVVVWTKSSDPEPGPDTEGYVLDYDKESGLLRLVKKG